MHLCIFYAFGLVLLSQLIFCCRYIVPRKFSMTFRSADSLSDYACNSERKMSRSFASILILFLVDIWTYLLGWKYDSNKTSIDSQIQSKSISNNKIRYSKKKFCLIVDGNNYNFFLFLSRFIV